MSVYTLVIRSFTIMEFYDIKEDPFETNSLDVEFLIMRQRGLIGCYNKI